MVPNHGSRAGAHTEPCGRHGKHDGDISCMGRHSKHPSGAWQAGSMAGRVRPRADVGQSMVRMRWAGSRGVILSGRGVRENMESEKEPEAFAELGKGAGSHSGSPHHVRS